MAVLAAMVLRIGAGVASAPLNPRPSEASAPSSSRVRTTLMDRAAPMSQATMTGQAVSKIELEGCSSCS
jgi:hypothetical protein